MVKILFIFLIIVGSNVVFYNLQDISSLEKQKDDELIMDMDSVTEDKDMEVSDEVLDDEGDADASTSTVKEFGVSSTSSSESGKAEPVDKTGNVAPIKKRLSGAQRRKLKKLRAQGVVEGTGGEPAPRGSGGADGTDPDRDLMPPPATPRAGKRTRPVGNTPSPSAVPPVLRRKTNEEAAITTGSIDRDGKQLTVWVEKDKDGTEAINFRCFKTALEGAALSHRGFPIRIDSTGLVRGSACVECTNQASAEWVMHMVGELGYSGTFKEPECPQFKRIKVFGFWPDKEVPDRHVLMGALGRQNPNLTIQQWIFLGSKPSKGGHTITLGIPENFIVELNEVNWRPYFGVGRLSLWKDRKVVKSGGDSEATGGGGVRENQGDRGGTPTTGAPSS